MAASATASPYHGSSSSHTDATFVGKYTHYSMNCTKKFTRDSWIIDTGATDHMASNKSLLTSINSLLSPINIHQPNGTMSQVHIPGSVHLDPSVTLLDTLFVADFPYNLLSVKTAANYKVVAHVYHCLLFFPGPED